MASALAGKPAAFVNADVALDGEPVIGSFTVDGLTYAVIDDSHVELVGVSPDWQQVTNSQEGEGFGVAPMLASGSDGVESETATPSVILSEGAEGPGVEGSDESHASEAGVADLALPETVTYENADYALASIGAYAFYLSDVTDVTLPANVSDVDDRAFRSSDVASITVAEGNPTYSSYDGVLYDADLTSLLLIPEGRVGAVRIPAAAKAAPPSAFSHCAGVDAIAADADGAAFASENGLLYTSDLTTLLRVPAGAEEITIREGCTTIAAGALEACAKLTTINAPATVTSISPDVFHAIPTVSLPAASVILGESGDAAAPSVILSEGTEGPEVEESNEGQVSGVSTQLTAMVALSSTNGDLPEVGAADIKVFLAENVSNARWHELGFRCWVFGGTGAPSDAMLANEETNDEALMAAVREAASYQADTMTHVATVGKNDKAGGTGFVEISPDYDWARTTDAYAAVPSGPSEGLEYAQGNWIPLTWANIYVYSHARYGYIWGGTSGSPVMYIHARDKATHRRLKIGSYRLKKPAGCTVNDDRPYPVMFDDIQLPFALSFDPAGGVWDDGTAEVKDVANVPYSLSNQVISIPQPTLQGMEFLGWYDAKGKQVFAPDQLTATSDISQFDAELSGGSAFKLSAQWRSADCDLGFDVDSEPGDEDYPGVDKPEQTITGEQIENGHHVEIEDPKRPGYVFQGWTIPNAEGTEAIDQDLVYQGDNGKWYVDASKLPDYAGEDGRVELTARWTSVISVDVPSSVTFYADVVTQGNESREGLASSAFGQNKVQSQSEVDLRIVGLESKQFKGNGSTSLGASDILKKKDGSALPTTSDKLFSLYPATGELKEDDLKDPDATSASKPVGAVDFSLDDILLEKSFAADDFTIPAGDTLSLGYRLNLQETSTELDYDKLSTLSEGASASIANISYCFAADAPYQIFPTGSKADPLWVELSQEDSDAFGFCYAAPGVYGLADIKTAADDISTHADNPAQSVYYDLYKALLDKQVTNNGKPGVGPYFQLKVDKAYLPLQLIGICQDVRSGGGKAGLTFQLRDIYAHANTRSTAAGGGSFNHTYMNPTDTSSGGWASSAMRTTLRSTFWDYFPAEIRSAIVPVDKFQQLYIGSAFNNSPSYLQKTTDETVWLPSVYEVFGAALKDYNESEALTNVAGYKPFQYLAYQGNNGSSSNAKSLKMFNGSAGDCWLRSVIRLGSMSFCRMHELGFCSSNLATYTWGVAPAFCL